MTFPKLYGLINFSKTFPGLEIAVLKFHDFSRFFMTVRTLLIVTNPASVAPSDRHQREASPSTNRFFRTSFPMTPCLRLITCTGADHYPGYIARALHSLVAKSCFATANISERLSLVSLPVYYLD